MYINVVGHEGGIFETNGFGAHGGVEGKWLAFSLAGLTVPVGYHHLVNLKVDPPMTACTTKPVVFTKGVLANPKVSRGKGKRKRKGQGKEGIEAVIIAIMIIIIIVVMAMAIIIMFRFLHSKTGRNDDVLRFARKGRR